MLLYLYWSFFPLKNSVQWCIIHPVVGLLRIHATFAPVPRVTKPDHPRTVRYINYQLPTLLARTPPAPRPLPRLETVLPNVIFSQRPLISRRLRAHRCIYGTLWTIKKQQGTEGSAQNAEAFREITNRKIVRYIGSVEGHS